MKSIDQLQKLAENPFYTMDEEEKQVLNEANAREHYSSVQDENKKKESQVVLGNAAVKEIGKLHKHATDPI